MDVIAYIDESGTHEDSPLTVMAGYISSPERWNAFEIEWESLLAELGVDHLHAKELFHGEKPFAGLPWKIRAEIADRATATIMKHVMLGFVVVLDNNDYREIFKGVDVPKRISLDSKYGICFRHVVSFLPQYLARHFVNEDYTIFLVLESGSKNQGAPAVILEQYRSMTERELARMVKNVAFAKKRECYGVQAADLLAFTSARGEREGLLPHEAVDLAAVNVTRDADGPSVVRLPVTRGTLSEIREAHVELANLKKRLGKKAMRALALVRKATDAYLEIQDTATDQAEER